jgi:uncharacterized membrane protein
MKYSLLLLLFYSCTYNELELDCDTMQIFTDSVSPIIKNNCTSCHSQSGGVPPMLETYEEVVNAVDNFSLNLQVSNKLMPPVNNTPLTNSEIMIISNWINCE